MPDTTPNAPDTYMTHGERLSAIETFLKMLEDNYLASIKEQTLKTNSRVTALEALFYTLDKLIERTSSNVQTMKSLGGAILMFLAGALIQHLVTDKITDFQQILVLLQSHASQNRVNNAPLTR